MLTKQHAHRVGACIADPGADENHPYNIVSVWKDTDQVYKGKHDRCIDITKQTFHYLVRMISRKKEHIYKQL